MNGTKDSQARGPDESDSDPVFGNIVAHTSGPRDEILTHVNRRTHLKRRNDCVSYYVRALTGR